VEWFVIRDERELLRMPVLNDCWGRVYYCSIHVKQETRKRHLLGWEAVIWLRAHFAVLSLRSGADAEGLKR
jgi:hypothetical protein